MRYINKVMDKSKEAIQASFGNEENKYEEISDIIDNRWEVQLNRPFMLLAFTWT